MRRLLAYVLLSSALVLGSAAVATPTLVSMDTDISYGYGRDLVFKISPHSEENYNGIDPVEEGAYVVDDGYVAVTAVAEEMTKRLDAWGVSDYSVAKEGYDTVRVRLRTENNSATEYEYLEYYLPFSGGHISVAASMDQEEDYAYDTAWAEMFTGQTATIEYISDSTIPVVVVPVNSEGEDGALGRLLDYCDSKYVAADSSASTEEVNCYVVLWSHKQDTDTFDAATGSNGASVDANVAKRFLGAENAANAWFTEAEEDDNYTRFQYIPSSAAFNGNTSYDPSQADAAYKAAFFYMSLFNASDYAELGAGYDVSFAFSAVASPEVEGMIDRGFSLTPAMNATLIASLVGLGIAIVVLALFFRMGALAALSSLCVSLVATMLLIGYFHAQFGIGMVLGLCLVALLSLFGSIYYLAKLKDEIYRGRTLKKAHAEAAKKAFWPTLDAGIISVVAGLCIYFLVPAETSMAGLSLVIGGFFATIASLLLTRVQMWLFAGDGDSASKVGGLLGIEKAKVPDLLKEEKQTYFGLFAKTKFMKPWKGVIIASGVLLVASIVGLSVFSAVDGGAPFAAASLHENSRAYISYRIADGATNDVFNGLDDIDNGTDGVLNLIYVDGEMLSTHASKTEMVTTSITLTNSAEVEDGVYNVLNFIIDFDTYYSPTEEGEFVLRLPSGEETTYESLDEALSEAVLALNVDPTSYDVSLKEVVYEEVTPSFTDVAIGLSVSLVVIGAYLSIRYGLSRGLSASLYAGASSFIALGLLSLCRVPALPIAAIGAFASLLLGAFLAIFILGKEKEIAADSHERDKKALEFRAKTLLDANAQGAAELLIFGIIAAYAMVAYLAFGPSVYSLTFLVGLVGVILSMLMLLVLIVPSSLFLAKQFSKIKLDTSFLSSKKKKKGNLPRKGSEPEEAVFIGIND